MKVQKRQQTAPHRDQDRVRIYRYGADREGARPGASSFAGGGCGGVVCGRP